MSRKPVGRLGAEVAVAFDVGADHVADGEARAGIGAADAAHDDRVAGAAATIASVTA